MKIHHSHRTRFSMDASSYDEICVLCGSTDGPIERGNLREECPAADSKREEHDRSKPEHKK